MLDEQQIARTLARELDELRARAHRIESHLHGSEEAPKDWEELAVHRENDEVVEALDGITRQRIREIEQTLARIEAGDWRSCRLCGGPIDEARLRAMPTVDTCIRCATRLEEKR